jgi:L-methionine (R)-S-oxide reductase
MTKEEQYRQFLADTTLLITDEPEEVSVLANVAAAIKETFHFFWVGFYLVRPKDTTRHLILGPFQGSPACYRIGYGKGVCGTAWKKRQTQVVPDVELFPGHIACSSLSRSEIVVPIFSKAGEVVAVLDIDSDTLSTFDTTDQRHLEQLCHIITQAIY